jgi:putative transposase
LGLKRIKFTDHNGIGELRLVGTYDLAHYHPSQIKRVRLVRRADGYYCQFCIKADGTVESEPTGRAIGLDLGIRYFLADSNGHTEESPHFYRRSEQQLNRYNRQKSKKYRQGVKPQSRNYHKARGRYARKHLRVSRQRKEYVKKLAYCVIQSNDLVAYENLNVSTPG